MKYDAIIVGGGIAGLTSAAYLTKYGYKTLLCEKENTLGGLVNSFERNGFTLDGGIRAIENLGIIFPMLKKLGIDIEFVENKVSIGIEDTMVDVEDKESLIKYQQMLNKFFPDNIEDIQKIIDDIRKIMHYMDIQYGIDNPLFLDIKEDRDYFIKTIVPWMFKYIMTFGKISKLKDPIEEYLNRFTDNQVLIDIIAQHFFTNTPAYFALSYFSLYIDYSYPKGGTGKFVEKIEQFIADNGGEISTETMIDWVDVENKIVGDTKGNEYSYDKLIWAADAKRLSEKIKIESIKKEKLKNIVIENKEFLKNKRGGNSIITVYALYDVDKSYFEKKSKSHLFYTPHKIGLSQAKIEEIKNKDGSYVEDKQKLIEWLMRYYKYNTFEISIPVMKDENLAPKGKTALIISVLIEYDLVEHISNMGWYEEFKKLSESCMTDVLYCSIYPDIFSKLIDIFSATPMTFAKKTDNTDGAITGWAFTNDEMPAVNKLQFIAKSINTPYPNIYQAGQWTFSPSGLPISVLTGKLAAEKVKKRLKKK